MTKLRVGRAVTPGGTIEEAIIEINGLTPDAALYAGRRLQIPVLDPPEQLQAMADYKALDTPAHASYNGVTK